MSTSVLCFFQVSLTGDYAIMCSVNWIVILCSLDLCFRQLFEAYVYRIVFLGDCGFASAESLSTLTQDHLNWRVRCYESSRSAFWSYLCVSVFEIRNTQGRFFFSLSLSHSGPRSKQKTFPPGRFVCVF